jgi:hypothetical protein
MTVGMDDEWAGLGNASMYSRSWSGTHKRAFASSELNMIDQASSSSSTVIAIEYLRCTLLLPSHAQGRIASSGNLPLTTLDANDWLPILGVYNDCALVSVRGR